MNYIKNDGIWASLGIAIAIGLYAHAFVQGSLEDTMVKFPILALLAVFLVIPYVCESLDVAEKLRRDDFLGEVLSCLSEKYLIPTAYLRLCIIGLLGWAIMSYLALIGAPSVATQMIPLAVLPFSPLIFSVVNYVTTKEDRWK